MADEKDQKKEAKAEKPAAKAAGKPAGAEPKKKKKKKQKLGLVARLKETMKLYAGSMGELAAGILSKDSSTRMMSILFWIGLIGTVFFSLMSFKVLMHHGKEMAAEAGDSTNVTADNIGKMIEREREEAHYKYATLNIGKFIVELKPTDGYNRHPPGVIGMAEIEIVIECDGKTTCQGIEKRKAMVRDRITDVFLAIDRTALQSIVGKRQLRDQVREKINDWLRKGEVKEVFFNNIIVG